MPTLLPTGTITPIKNWSYLEEYRELAGELHEAVSRVFASGRLILGPQVAVFESSFAAYCGQPFGIGVNSGTDAIFLALKALEVGPGDEVVTVANTAVPTVAAIRATGATPVFVDVDDATCLMDVARLDSALTPRTKALVPVHLYGHAVDMEPLLSVARARGLAVVEDCAQSHGCRYRGTMTGGLGTIGAFSFYPTKILGAYGDGGMCVTSSEAVAQRLRELRMYGMRGEYYAHREGYNSRLDEVQAAILSVKLRVLDQFIARRQHIARRYDEALHGLVRIPTITADSTHVYYLYVVRHPERDRLVSALRARGIEIGIHFPHPIHLMEAYRFLGYHAGDLPVTERAAHEIFSLPMYPHLSDAAVDTVVTTLKSLLT